MKKLLLFALFFPLSSSAQTLDSEQLRILRNSFDKNPQTRAAQNAVQSTRDIRSLVLDVSRRSAVDHDFRYRVDNSGLTDQKGSARCWAFSALNVVRPYVMKKYDLGEFYFSMNYIYFWDMLEKSNFFIHQVIRMADRPFDDRELVYYLGSPVQEGGAWNMYADLIEKYGVVPASVMPETPHSDYTNQMRGLINDRLRRAAFDLKDAIGKGLSPDQVREETLRDIYRILAICLGEPPTEFTWKYTDRKGNTVSRKMTPLEFYAETVPSDYGPANYIMIMHDPTREYYRMYEVDQYRNTVDGLNWTYLNLPIEDIKTACLNSIKANESLYASSDVARDRDGESGIADTGLYDYESLFGVKFTQDKKAAILTRQIFSRHAMVLMGCDTDENDRPLKWQFENSYGPAADHKGYFTVTDSWFEEYSFRFVVNRKYLNTRAVKCLDQQPVLLPVWDHMH